MKAEDEFSNWNNLDAWAPGTISVGDSRPKHASPCGPSQAAEGCERAKKAEFKGAPVSDNWSNPNAWVGGTVPVSDRELNVQLDVSATEDLGNAKAPFFYQ